MGRKQNRCSKKQREIRRIEHANTWTDGFEYGYRMGYVQAVKDGETNENVSKRKIPAGM